MWIGIDFGTSYSAAAGVVDGVLQHVPFGAQRQFRTAAYFPRDLPTLEGFTLTAAMEHEADIVFRASKRAQDLALREHARAVAAAKDGAPRIPAPAVQTDEQLWAQAVRTQRSQWLQEQHRREVVARDALSAASFGEEAIAAFIDDPRGRLFQSPKSLIGFKLMPGVREVIHSVLTSVLSHIRFSAGEHFGRAIDGAVIGRPVRFKSSMGAAGDEQALDMLGAAALAAGFTDVAFMHEPEAAALDWHALAPDRHRFLVVDIGGGTSDISLAEGGGAEPFQPIRSWGEAVGGGDVDYWLSLLEFMGLFGRNVGRHPNHIYSEAALVSDHVRQARFRAYDFGDYDSPYRERLAALQDGATTVRMAGAAEQLKIHLSANARGDADLGYIEPGLAVTTGKDNLDEAASYFLARFAALLDTVHADLDAAPARIVLTGGASAAPYVAEAVAARFPGVELVRSDPSLAIVSGLARAAEPLTPAPPPPPA
jgi:hypothetical chaperone protein